MPRSVFASPDVEVYKITLLQASDLLVRLMQGQRDANDCPEWCPAYYGDCNSQSECANEDILIGLIRKAQRTLAALSTDDPGGPA